MSHYDVLGTSPDAGADELRRAFVRLARRFHPDRHVGADPATRREAERRMREITEAWAVLGDPERRRRYDLGMGDRARSGSSGSAGSAGPGSGGSTAGRGGPGAAGAGAAGAGPAGRSGSGSRATGGARTTGAAGTGGGTGSEGRDWRAYAPSSGASSQRSPGQQLIMLSPLFCVATAGGFGVLGALIGWPPFFAMALVCLIVAAAAFFMLPIWAMTRGSARKGRSRGPKRTY